MVLMKAYAAYNVIIEHTLIMTLLVVTKYVHSL